MPDSDNWRRNAITRRNAIRAGLVGSAGMLAGCGGGGDGTTAEETPTETDSDNGNGDTSDDGDDGGSDVTVHDARFTELDRQGTPPMERHLNPWNPTQVGCWFPGQAMFDRLAVYSPASDESFPIIANSWEMTGPKTLEVELSDQWTWHNGDQFVAEDWATQWQIEAAIASAGEGGDTIYENIEAVDDTFLRIEINQELSAKRAVQNTIAAGHGEIGRGVFTKHDMDPYQSWHEMVVDGSDIQSAIDEIAGASEPNIQNAVGNGPFQMKEVGDAEIIMERYEDHPNAEDINFKEYAYWVPSSTGEVFQPYANEVVDATSKGFPVQDDLRQMVPENTRLFREALSSNKLFAFNLGNGVPDSIVSNRNVRRALVHVFNREQIKPLLQGVNQPFSYPPCRVPGKVLEDETHSAATFVKDNFEKYAQGNTSRAAELLRQEGFEQDGSGQWMTPEGETFEVSMLNPANRPDFQVWIQNLTDFGVAVSQENIDSATFDQRRKNGNYDIIPDGSSANGVFAMWAPSLIVDWVMKTLTHAPVNAEIPMPIGDPAGSSGMKEINIPNHINQWMVTDEDQYHQELMWWWNQYIPEFEAMYQPDAGALNTTNFDFNNVPDAVINGIDDALTISTKLPEHGSLQYKP